MGTRRHTGMVLRGRLYGSGRCSGELPSDGMNGLITIIAGGRDYKLTLSDEAWLDTLPIREVVSGGASGADAGGEAWAKKRGIPIKRFPADWKTHGRAAGPIRNRQMAEYADAVVLFPGGRGTDSMRTEAERQGLRIFTL